MASRPKTAPSSSVAAVQDDKSKPVNVQVILRCRPVSEGERKDNSQYNIVSTNSEKKEVVVNQGVAASRNANNQCRNFNFDQVFGPYSTQQEVFDAAVAPIVEEVLEGFNCTIFAYGQTGTGKTYTMEGDMANQIHAGVIPRSIYAIFEALEQAKTEYSMRVSFLEIYNEELQDLLTEDKRQLRIFEDPNSKKSMCVQNLEELPVNNPTDIFSILQCALKKRKTAETLLNRNSSRSHSIFSVTIHIKESTPDGEDVIKIGKLNLVDLAGSENIGRSGAMNARAKEAGMINQSLLTLGRVITALVEHHPHIPYRDSKLTRLLQDSLGGKTKTCIIATVSPSSLCLEETLSTLDYAHRAKNIRNKPEVNQKMTKRMLIREMTQEIERLKTELVAAREKNGVYLPFEVYQTMEAKMSSQDGQLGEIEGLLAIKEKELQQLKDLFEEKENMLNAEVEQHNQTRTQLMATAKELDSTIISLEETKTELEEKVVVIQEHVVTETKLLGSAKDIIDEFSTSVTHVDGLHAKIGRKQTVENVNKELRTKFGTQVQETFDAARNQLIQLESTWTEQKQRQQEGVSSLLKTHEGNVSVCTTQLQSLLPLVQSQCDISLALVKGYSSQAAKVSGDIAAQQTVHLESVSSKMNHMQGQHEATVGTVLEVIHHAGCASNQVVSKVAEFVANSVTSDDAQLEAANSTLQRLEHKLSEESAQHIGHLTSLENALLEMRRTREETMRKQTTSMLQTMQQMMEASMKEQLSQMDAVVVAMQSSLSQTLSNLTQWQSSNVAHIQQLVDANKQFHSRSFDCKESLQQVVNEQSQIIRGDLDSSVQKITTSQQQIETHVNDILKSAVVHCEEMKCAQTKGQADLESIVSSLAGQHTETTNRVQTFSNESLMQLQHLHHSLTDQVDRIEDSLCADLVSLKDSHVVLDAKLGGCRELIQGFLSGLKEDVPTGVTPVKRDWRVIAHTDLPRTRPHEVILKEIRASQATVSKRVRRSRRRSSSLTQLQLTALSHISSPTHTRQTELATAEGVACVAAASYGSPSKEPFTPRAVLGDATNIR
eukprot:GILK01003956.1.p1 GENE.GILK01003956.1~~GILK01003956.1.p1  ORF type:complete len:1069 (-),score=203.24 GILK01003956.1:91-3261(-)